MNDTRCCAIFLREEHGAQSFMISRDENKRWTILASGSHVYSDISALRRRRYQRLET